MGYHGDPPTGTTRETFSDTTCMRQCGQGHCRLTCTACKVAAHGAALRRAQHGRRQRVLVGPREAVARRDHLCRQAHAGRTARPGARLPPFPRPFSLLTGTSFGHRTALHLGQWPSVGLRRYAQNQSEQASHQNHGLPPLPPPPPADHLPQPMVLARTLGRRFTKARTSGGQPRWLQHPPRPWNLM